jgi:tRNA threonylcarbamoyladenosine biosynthesis protein TsaE
MSLLLSLDRPQDTVALGRCLATAFLTHGPSCLLLQGHLGSGKTTLTRCLVESLPGGGQAMVSSPSFNLVNIYPTSPEVAHIDLYRLENMVIDEDILDTIHGQGRLIIVEWSEHLDPALRPGDHILGTLVHDAGGPRRIVFEPHGPCAGEIIDMVRSCLTSERDLDQLKEQPAR